MYRKDQYPLVANRQYLAKDNAVKNLIKLLANLSIINLEETSVEDVIHGYVHRVTGLMFYVPEKEQQ